MWCFSSEDGTIEAGTSKPLPFDIVHSFSRFFRDHFELEFYIRRLAKNGVRLVSITQEMGDDSMHVTMRPIMALFHEHQPKENAKHVLRALQGERAPEFLERLAVADRLSGGRRRAARREG
jgi:hypothetical protein